MCQIVKYVKVSIRSNTYPIGFEQVRFKFRTNHRRSGIIVQLQFGIEMFQNIITNSYSQILKELK